METNENQQNEITIDQAKGHHDPMPLVVITANGKDFGYDFRKLIWLQMCYAEELAQWKKEQLESQPKDYRQVELSKSNEYAIKLASILFTPMAADEPVRFKRGMSETTMESLELISDPETIKKIELCLMDFFQQRGQRRLASATLTRTGSLNTMFKSLAGMMMSSTGISKLADSSIPESSNAELNQSSAAR